MGLPLGRLLQGLGKHPLDIHVKDGAGSSGAGFVGKAVQAAFTEARPPFAHRHLVKTQDRSHSLVGMTFRAGKDDTAPLRESLRARRPAGPALQGFALLFGGDKLGFGASFYCHRCLPSSQKEGTKR